MRRVAIVGLVLLAAGCDSRTQIIPSPDMTMTLVTSIEQSRTDSTAYKCVVLEIRSTNGSVFLKENTHAADFSRWSFSWEGNDRIKLESSDIGTYYWSKGSNNVWKKEL